jgi:hypothetical protein
MKATFPAEDTPRVPSSESFSAPLFAAMSSDTDPNSVCEGISNLCRPVESEPNSVSPPSARTGTLSVPLSKDAIWFPSSSYTSRLPFPAVAVLPFKETGGRFAPGLAVACASPNPVTGSFAVSVKPVLCGFPWDWPPPSTGAGSKLPDVGLSETRLHIVCLLSESWFLIACHWPSAVSSS